jgi:hypothetical protein
LKQRHPQLVLSGALQPLQQQQAFASFLRPLFRQDWVVYLKPPFGSAQHVLRYLAGYTHRVAISNHRLLAFQRDQVTFRWKDYAHGNKQRMMTLSAQEFLRRFLLHVLPRGFVRISFLRLSRSATTSLFVVYLPPTPATYSRRSFSRPTQLHFELRPTLPPMCVPAAHS